ncbi:MAG: hypothetical protein WB760_14305 [Xanthobacteraceae bacterium]
MTTPDWQFLVKKATENWLDWKNVYEHSGVPRDNPLLVDDTKFESFLIIYSVGRTIRSGTSEQLRNLLCSPQFQLTTLLDDTTGSKIDEQNSILRAQFGTHQGQRGLRSALSKIAAFLAPHAFNAWDTQARKGLKRTLQRRSPRTYAEYLAGVNELLAGELGERVRDACIDNYPTQYAKDRDRFHRRVLDRYLMDRGGRPRRE